MREVGELRGVMVGMTVVGESPRMPVGMLEGSYS